MALRLSTTDFFDKHGLLWARVAWVAILLFGLSLYILSFKNHLNALIAGPTNFDPILQYYSISLQELDVLLRLGLPASFYPYYIVTFETLWVLSFLLPALILRLKKFSDRMALFLSLTLLAYGFFATPLMYTFTMNAQPILRFLITFICGTSLAGFFITWFLFPDGHFVPAWTGRFGFIFVLLSTLWLFTYIFFPTIPRIYLFQAAAPIFLSCFAIGFYAQAYRYIRVSSPLQQQQTKWVMFGFITMMFGMSINLLPILLIPSLLTGPMRIWYLLFSTPITVLSITMIPLSITFSILRYRLWDIDLLIRRTLVYTALSASLALVYYSSIVVLQLVFRSFTGQAATSQAAIVLSTLAIAALFTPLRRRIQTAIDQRFYRRKYNTHQTLQAFADSLRDEVDLGQLNERLVEVVQETMQPDSITLWLRETSSKISS